MWRSRSSGGVFRELRYERGSVKMKKMIKAIALIIVACTGIAIVVTRFEKNGGIKRRRHASHETTGCYERSIKRPMDLALALIAVAFLWPVMLVLTVMVRVKLGSPVLFKQERPGLRRAKYPCTDTRKSEAPVMEETIFTLYKFRTMTDERDAEGNLLPDEERMTSFGKWLRSTSLDELPELINIIRGDMSIVGPRPLLTEYLPLYSEEQHRRHDVRPGLTGLAQTHGRNELSWEDKFRDDVEYVDHITFAGDVKIIAATVRSVIRREGISSETSATMERFEGNEGTRDGNG